MYRIELKSTRKKQVEYLRGSCGNFNNEVFFWDCVLAKEFDSIEHVLSFVHDKMNVFDLEDINIIKAEVCL